MNLRDEMVSKEVRREETAFSKAPAAHELDDAALAAACRAGDADAFAVLVRRYKDRLYHVVYRYAGNQEDALDITQEAFIRAWRKFSDFRGDAAVYTWLYSIALNLARNRARDLGRKGRNMGVSLEALQDAAPAPAANPGNPRETAAEHELQGALEECLGALAEHYRLAFVLRVFDGRSYDEIAVAADCPKGTVKSRLNQARRQLRACLEGKGVLQDEVE